MTEHTRPHITTSVCNPLSSDIQQSTFLLECCAVVLVYANAYMHVHGMYVHA